MLYKKHSQPYLQQMVHIMLIMAMIYISSDESSEALDSVEEWNPEEEAWTTVQILESPRGGFAAVSLADLSLFCD